MEIVGLMVARDEELACGMTVDTVSEIVDRIVFVNHCSKDRTAEIVRERSAAKGIPLHEVEGAKLNMLPKDVRALCYQAAKKLNPNWFFLIDADMVFTNQKMIRECAEVGEYDQYWYRSLNLYGDMTRTTGLNMKHMFLFRNHSPVSQIEAVYICPESTHKSDPDVDRFIAWNLDGLKYYGHIFRRFQLWYTRAWNQHHGTNWGVNQFVHHYFNGGVSEYYKKTYVLNRIRLLSKTPEWVADRMKITPTEFHSKYFSFPPILKNWKCPFKLKFGTPDEKGLDVIGREPDLIDVPVLPNDKIYQLKHQKQFKEWLT